ncbi:MAG: Uma2 family endonuclease [Desulfobacteraceae bacterium]|nr:Uma2 family endonuclease [Desulfobacteraceae bacterium]
MKALEKKEPRKSGVRIFRAVPGKNAGKEPEKEIIYPESDGKPMSDNTKQYLWIVKIKEGIESLFADANVFVAADLFWYPVEGKNKTKAAPDVMVAFGRPKGDRGSYLQWKEGDIAPQAVFEILSPGNTRKEMDKKFKFYEQHGVEEYYIYDPDKIEFKGWTRSGKRLLPIKNTQGWVSPRLKIRFEIIGNEELTVIRPDGRKFLSFLETEAEMEAEKKRAGKAEKKAEAEKKRAGKAEKKVEAERKRAEKIVEAERKKAEAEKKRAGKAEKKAEAEKKRAGKAEKIAEAERKKAQKMAEKLRALGIDPESL